MFRGPGPPHFWTRANSRGWTGPGGKSGPRPNHIITPSFAVDPQFGFENLKIMLTFAGLKKPAKVFWCNGVLEREH